MVYNFEYAQQDFPLSASVLVLSDTRSMFKNALHVPAKNDLGDADHIMTDEKFEEIVKDQDLMQQLRRYFMLSTHFSELTHQNYKVSKAC